MINDEIQTNNNRIIFDRRAKTFMITLMYVILLVILCISIYLINEK